MLNADTAAISQTSPSPLAKSVVNSLISNVMKSDEVEALAGHDQPPDAPTLTTTPTPQHHGAPHELSYMCDAARTIQCQPRCRRDYFEGYTGVLHSKKTTSHMKESNETKVKLCLNSVKMIGSTASKDASSRSTAEAPAAADSAHSASTVLLVEPANDSLYPVVASLEFVVEPSRCKSRFTQLSKLSVLPSQKQIENKLSSVVKKIFSRSSNSKRVNRLARMIVDSTMGSQDAGGAGGSSTTVIVERRKVSAAVATDADADSI